MLAECSFKRASSYCVVYFEKEVDESEKMDNDIDGWKHSEGGECLNEDKDRRDSWED